jgi:hypothetical protein
MNALLITLCFTGMALVFAHGCSSRDIQRCGVLPDQEGCPVGRGGTCEDQTCAALYNCLDGSWVLAETCDQTAGGGGTPSGGAGGVGGQACNGIEVDRTGEFLGSCSPSLQEPDCPAGAAELCRPCQTSCVDFFLCREDGWAAIAFCDDEGHVVVEP